MYSAANPGIDANIILVYLFAQDFLSPAIPIDTPVSGISLDVFLFNQRLDAFFDHPGFRHKTTLEPRDHFSDKPAMLHSASAHHDATYRAVDLALLFETFLFQIFFFFDIHEGLHER